MVSSAMPIALLFGVGLQHASRARGVRAIALLGAWATVACGLLNFVVELALRAGLLPRGEPLQWW